MTVTRTRLDSPPNAPSSAATSTADLAAEARQHRDQLRILEYFAGRTGQRRDVAQAVAGTRLPADRVLDALDSLVACGFLVRAGLRRHPGGWSPTWIRHDPAHSRQQEAQHD